MKLRVLIGFLCLIVGLNAKAQCNASFNDTSTVCAVIQFTDMSTGTNSLTQYFWNFPQGSPSTSTLQSPSATYTANGNYTVCLSIFNASPTCSSTACQTITINCFTTSCTANFNSSVCVPSGTNAQMFFSNTSPGTNSTTVYEWDLGNSATSTLINPTATYSANGTYSVCLSYTTYVPAYCTASICKTVNINCVPVNSCAASFFSVTCVSNTVTNSAQVSFSNTSTGTNSTTTYFWNFGNASTSTATNGITTYTANGTYTVCLSISTGSLCSDSICNVITVSCVPLPSPTCQANFTNTACNNGQMTFYSISSGTLNNTTYTWTSTPPPSGPPVHYTATVCLKFTNHNTVTPINTCSSSVCKSVLIDCSGIGFREYMIENAKVKVFPNPSNGSFTLDMNQISFGSPIIDLKVYNVIGELVHQSTEEVINSGTTKEIDLKGLANGAYYLRLNAGNKAYSVKLIIAK